MKPAVFLIHHICRYQSQRTQIPSIHFSPYLSLPGKSPLLLRMNEMPEEKISAFISNACCCYSVIMRKTSMHIYASILFCLNECSVCVCVNTREREIECMRKCKVERAIAGRRQSRHTEFMTTQTSAKNSLTIDIHTDAVLRPRISL